MIDLKKPRLTEKGNKYELLFGYEPLYARLQELENAIESGELVPVVHGEWEKSDVHNGFLVCSECKNCYIEPNWLDGLRWQYCPNCGAKMDVKDGDGE